MAARFVGEAFLNHLLGVLFNELVSPVVVNLIQRKKLNRKLVERLEITLYAAQVLLNDAEKRQIKERAVKNCLDILKDAVYKADDLLDEVSTKAATQKDAGNFLSRFLNLEDREIVNRIEDIIDTIESIVKQKDILGLKEIPKENLSWRITTSIVEASEIYGRDNDKEAITKLLLDDTSDGKISVIPIVGMGGIGKTTLAQLVYHDDQVKQNFDFQAWVCVSEAFDVVKITKIVKEAITCSSCNMNDLNLLQHDLNEKLSRRKFLIVLDDTWNVNSDDWNRFLKPFQNGLEGSKILLITRSRKVASVVKTVLPHELSPLSDEDCWSAFSKHAFLSTESTKNPTLEKIGRDIVKRCNGLPLAVQALGRLMRGNYDLGYWNDILKSEIWEFSEDRSTAIPALRLSYYYLSSSLKQCFVYCSLYPTGYQFNEHELILLWMAENFIQPIRGKTLEEVGYEYFDELVSRSFFQPCGFNVFVMHDLMHDLATFYAGEFYFRVEELGNAYEINIRTRHLSHIAGSNFPISELLVVCDRIKHARTFLEINLMPDISFNMENTPCILLSHLKCLRVLSFKCFPLDSLPDSISELIHLRYLDLSFSSIVTLPESLSNLYNLQTLKMKNCYKLKMLPSNMQNLANLCHLDIRCTHLEEMPKGMSKLKHLKLLSDFIVGKREGNSIKELGGLANLRGSLSITKLQNVIDSDQASKARMGKKRHINNLHLSWSSKDDIVDSQIERDILHELRPHVDLKELTISDYMGRIFPNWLGNSSYHSMTIMTLCGCRNCCVLPSLGELPFLNHLHISNFDGLEIIGAEFYKNDESSLETPFPSLETLWFYSMPRWQQWHSLEFDAFPRLKKLTIHGCPVLIGELPNQLPALETLEIDRCKQLNFSFPRAPAIHSLKIEDDNKVILGEPVLEAITCRQLTCLRSLVIRDCSFSTLGMFAPQLESLTILGCLGIDLFLQGVPQHILRYLSISLNEKMMSFLSSMNSHSHCLTHLNQCDGVMSFPKEGLLPASLESLQLRNFPSLETLDCKGLVHLTSIQRLTIYNCPKLENVAGERLSASLIQLYVIDSPLLGKRCETKDPQVLPKISHIRGIKVDDKWIW